MDKPAVIVSDSTSAIKERPPVPPRPKYIRWDLKTIKAITQYYKDNKDAILKDLAELGQKEMLKRWNIPGVTWRQPKGLAERWGIAIQTGNLKADRLEAFDKDKDAILLDYQGLRLRDFLKKWHINTVSWMKLKERWQVVGKKTAIASSNISRKTEREVKHLPEASTAVTETKVPKPETLRQAQGERGESGIQVVVIPLPPRIELPVYPAWNDAWTDTFKEKWLDTYRELAGSKV